MADAHSPARTTSAPSSRIRCVLFDLDDTLFDHVGASRVGLAELCRGYPCLAERDFAAVEREFFRSLEEMHDRVLRGQIAPDVARIERMRGLFAWAGGAISAEEAEVVARRYRAAHLGARKTVAGVVPLLEALRGRVIVGIVSNNFVQEQVDKLRELMIHHLIDFLVTAEEVGEPKPAPAIFRAALERAGCAAEEAVMIGDAWVNDILGARGAAIRPIWLNRFGQSCPDRSLAREIRSFEPTDAVLSLIFADEPVAVDAIAAS